MLRTKKGIFEENGDTCIMNVQIQKGGQPEIYRRGMGRTRGGRMFVAPGEVRTRCPLPPAQSAVAARARRVWER